MSKTREAVVRARCVCCGHERDIRAGEVPEGQQPYCERCMMPMVAKEARSV